MQRIEHKYTNVSKLFTHIEETYFLTSEMNKDSIVPSVFEPLINMFRKYTYTTCKIVYSPCQYELNEPIVESNEDIIVVCTSGGKDSVATAKYYKNMGFEVILYHMHGINKAYNDEYTSIPKIAEYLGCKYHIEDIKLAGSHRYVEHPMKNMLIANGAIHYCIENKLPVNIAFGNYQTSHIYDMEFEVCGGDSVEMWKVYENIIRTIIPRFKIYTPLVDVSDTYDILDDDLYIIENCISCMSPYRFREHWKHRTEDKYAVTLMKHRCGCCAKCCLEYMVLVDNGTLDYNKEYYQHCFDILKKTTQKETGRMNVTMNEVWSRYFWYDMLESHLI